MNKYLRMEKSDSIAIPNLYRIYVQIVAVPIYIIAVLTSLFKSIF